MTDAEHNWKNCSNGQNHKRSKLFHKSRNYLYPACFELINFIGCLDLFG